MYPAKDYSASQNDFVAICNDLATLGVKGHEHIKLERHAQGYYYPVTASKPRWFEPIHHFWKPQHLRYANVSAFLITFLQKNQDLIAQHPESIKALNHLRARFISKDQFIGNLKPIFKVTGEQFSKTQNFKKVEAQQLLDDAKQKASETELQLKNLTAQAQRKADEIVADAVKLKEEIISDAERFASELRQKAEASVADQK